MVKMMTDPGLPHVTLGSRSSVTHLIH